MSGWSSARAYVEKSKAWVAGQRGPSGGLAEARPRLAAGQLGAA